MNKLNELLQELCPEGVEYKPIQEIAIDIYRGSGIKRDQVTTDGIPCVRYGEIYTTYNIWFDKCVSHTQLEFVDNPKYFEYGDILFAITGESVEEIAKSTAYVGHEKCLAGGDIVVLKHNQNPKYLSYVLSTTNAQMQKSKGKVKSKVVHSSVPAIENIVVPVPPIEVQSEIVRILDNFTELTVELTVELTARKRQYEYYRNTLLNSMKVDLTNTVLGEIADIHTGNKPDIILEEETEFDYINAGTSRSGYTSTSNCEGDTVTTPSRGQGGIGFVGYQSKPFYLGPLCYSVRSKNTSQVKNKYIYYWLCSHNSDILAYKKEGGTPALNRSDLMSISISYPCEDMQQRIVHILDNFETICSNLNIGLPAEIEARQKQYEYYRDALLRFDGSSHFGNVERERERERERDARGACIKD